MPMNRDAEDTDEEWRPSCGYCGSENLAYELESGKGTVVRCIPCLAIEQGQQKIRMPFDRFVDLEADGIVYDSDEELRERRQDNYEICRSWWVVLARIQQDDPIVIKDPGEFDTTLHEHTREFLTNIMGLDAHSPPSDVAESDVAVGQTTFEEVDE